MNRVQNSESTIPTIKKEDKHKHVALANTMPATVSAKPTKSTQIDEVMKLPTYR